MKKILRNLSVLAFVLVLNACGTTSTVTSKLDNKKTLNEAKTYALFINESNKSQNHKLNDLLIVDAIVQEMKEKGLVESENPDISIMINTQYIQEKRSNKQRVITLNTEKGGDKIASRRVLSVTPKTITYVDECFLDIEFVNSKNNESLWRGNGSKVIDRKSYNRQKQIDKLIDYIL